jgi:hypothetical protein
VDILPLNLRVLNLILISGRECEGSELEENYLVPGGIGYFLYKILLHLFLDLGALSKKIVRSIPG